jgi:plastocyanin
MRSLLITALLLFTSSSLARTWTIAIDGNTGRYEPKDLFVEVGDTVVWVGDLKRDPLTFIDAPNGAKVPKMIKRGRKYSMRITSDGQYYFTSANTSRTGMGGIISASYYPSDRTIDFEMLRLPERPQAGDILHIELGFDRRLIEQVNLCFSDGMCTSTTNGKHWQDSKREIEYNLGSYPAGNYMFAVSTADTIYRRRLTLY